MKITADRKSLADTVSWVAKALPRQANVAALAGIRLHAADGRVTLSAFDYDISHEANVAAEVSDEGACLVPGRFLAEVLSALPGKTVDLELDGNQLKITSGRSSYAAQTMSLDDYPHIPAAPPSAGVISSAEQLASAVTSCLGPVAEREAAKAEARVRNANGRFLQALELDNAPAEITHELAEQWQGWGTALKPAFEPVVVARKPLSGTVAANVLAHGTGALNVDACRIGDSGGRRDSGLDSRSPASVSAYGDGLNGRTSELVPGLGRWPANVVLDESQADELDRQAPDAGGSGVASGPSLRDATAASTAFGARGGFEGDPAFYGDTGGASRFFYVPKADSSERPRVDGIAHPTVKPIDLMRWLVRLVTPPGGTVLEPFAGSGTTVEACLLEGFRVIAIERDETYVPLVLSRVERVRTIGTGLRPDDYGEALKALGKERDPDEGSLFDELGMVADA